MSHVEIKVIGFSFNISLLFPKELLTKLGKSKLVNGKRLTLPDLKSLLIASNTPNKFDA